MGKIIANFTIVAVLDDYKELDAIKTKIQEHPKLKLARTVTNESEEQISEA